jgi:hypothetical protein
MADKSTNDYPQASKDAFMSSCMSSSGGKQAACSCMLAKVQEHYTYGEMTDIEQKITSGQPPAEFTDFMKQTTQSCATAGDGSAMPSKSVQPQ